MKTFILTFLLLYPLSLLYGQPEETATFAGTIIEETSGSPVPGANVVVKSNGKMKAFASSDADGKFLLTIQKNLPDLSITVSATGYKTYTSPLNYTDSPLTVILADGALQLKEVVVKSKPITAEGDTLTYTVSSFAQSQDRSIGDVLRHMPGIDVAESGKIKYQGSEINKFYIEGSDLLEGKYGIATNGIDHRDVGAVEVMENHQPIRVLQGYSISDQAAINLKLKDRAKAKLTGHGMIGAGAATQPHGFVWDTDLFGMMIMGKYQNITTFKANNTGVRLADQLTRFYADHSDETITPYLSLSLPSPPQLRLKSTFLNRSWMASTNNLWKTGDGSDVKLQIDYLNDRATAAASSITSYILPEGEKVISEDRSSVSHRNALTAKVSTEINRKTFYLTNVLDADLSWNDLRLNTTGTLDNRQTAHSPEFHVSNRFKVMRRIHGSRLVTFKSINEWVSLPERLSVALPDGTYSEKIRQHSFYTDERISFGMAIRRVHIEMEGGVAGFFRSFSTDISDTLFPDQNIFKSLSTNYLRIFIKPSFKWAHRRVEAHLNVPLNLYSYFLSPNLADRTEFLFNPGLTLSWKPYPGVSVAVNGSISRSPASLHTLHPFPVLTDYRHVSTGTTDYLSPSAESVGFSLRWRHVPSGIFLNAYASRIWNHTGYETVRNVEDDFVFSSYRKSDTSSEMTIVRGDLSTNIGFINGVAGIRGNYIINDNHMISQGLPSVIGTRMIYVGPFINGAAGGIVNWSLRFGWDRNVMRVGSLSNRSTDSFIWNATLTLTPFTRLVWHSSLDHYRIQTAGGFVNMAMLDSRITFHLSKRIDITAGVSNILDKKDFSYTSYGTASEMETHSMLRGREFLISLMLKK